MKSVVFLFVIFAIPACSSMPNSKSVQTKFGTVNYLKAGDSGPSVILEAGLGDDMSSWKLAIKEIGEISQLLAYNRAGYQGSYSFVEQRTADNIIKELRSLMQKTESEPPYVLIGHSIGGLYMQLYAKKYPEDILGVVLVDSTHAGQDEDCIKKIAGICEQSDSIPWWAKAVLPDGVVGEHDSMPESMQQVRSASDFPSVPLVVLSRGKNPWEGEEQVKDWQKERWREAQENQTKLTLLSSNSKQIICDSCGHYVHQDKPVLVAEAILWILEKSQN